MAGRSGGCDGWRTGAAGLAVAAAVGACVAGGYYAVKGRSSQVFGPSMYAGTGDRRSVALTFDDGPSPGTIELLDYLAGENVRATFFQCGANVERHPEIARAVHEAGHEIGNHAYSHPRLCPRLGWQPNLLSSNEIFEEFARTQRLLQAMGIEPTLLRAPYGLRWFGLRETQRRLGLLGVMWTVIGRDWEWGAEAIARLVLEKTRPGGIICLHDGRDIRPNPDISATLAAVKLIVPALKRDGYAFETVSELMRAGKAVGDARRWGSGPGASACA